MYIAYVNNNTSSCKDSNPGTQDSPFCNITPAITANKPYINVAGSPKTYGTVALSSGGSFVIVGAGRDAMTTTILDQVNVTNGTLVLSNLQVLPSLASAAVTCNGSTSSIYLASTVVINGTGRGIDAEMNCGQLTVDRTFVNCKSNGFYGIIVGNSSGSMTSYRIVNSAVTQCGNMSGEPYGVLLQHQAQASTGYFAFNTVTGNYNGVSCSIGMPLIQNSIIAGNNEYNNTSVAQVNVCNTDSTVEMNSAHVVFSPTASGVPALATGNATNTMWIVDRGTPPPGNQSVPTDYFGVTRPQGQQYDIGFQELQ